MLKKNKKVYEKINVKFEKICKRQVKAYITKRGTSKSLVYSIRLHTLKGTSSLVTQNFTSPYSTTTKDLSVAMNGLTKMMVTFNPTQNQE